MKIGNFKGVLLEYIIRQLLLNCGFTNVKADNLYSFEKSGLFFVNGKGACHDADIITNPPIQMPFHYPTQLIFECKAYKSKAGLPIIRNALGLRNDLNDFEVVTKDNLIERKNNRRAVLAVETRNRSLYQVGVASINEFSKPAQEFAINNKIPLISLSWFFPSSRLQEINDLSQDIINSFQSEDIKNLYHFLKDRAGNIDNDEYSRAKTFLNDDNPISSIFNFAKLIVGYSYVGLLETGDIVYLFAEESENILKQNNNFKLDNAILYWNQESPDIWTLIIPDNNNKKSKYKFYLPKAIFDSWAKLNYDERVALDMKHRYFSKIFVFNKKQNPQLPFSIISIDREWLDSGGYC